MSEASPLDDRGRFTVDPKWREKLGRKVIQIWTPDGLLLLPADVRLRRNHFPGAPSNSGEDEALREVDERRKRLE